MSRVLVLYYSSWGHVETLAEAIAKGAVEAGAQVDIKRVAETVPEETTKAFPLQNPTKCTVGYSAGSCKLRRIYCRSSNPLWSNAIANGQFLGTGGRLLGKWATSRQGRRSIHIERYSTWWQ